MMNPNKRLKRENASSSPSPGPSSHIPGGSSTPASSSNKRTKAQDPADYDFEPDEDLERVRKEALYRSLLVYRRQNGRNESRLDQLEEQKRVLEASVRSVEACWEGLLSSVRLLLGSAANATATTSASASKSSEAHGMDVDSESKPIINGDHVVSSSLPSQTPSAGHNEPKSDDLAAFDLDLSLSDDYSSSASTAALESALRARLPLTLSLISRLVSLATSGQLTHLPGGTELAESVEKYMLECAALKQTLATVRAENADLRNKVEEGEEEKTALEKKQIRWEVEAGKWKRKAEGRGESSADGEFTNGSGGISSAGVEGVNLSLSSSLTTATGLNASRDDNSGMSSIKKEGTSATGSPRDSPKPNGVSSSGATTNGHHTLNPAEGKEIEFLRSRLSTKQAQLEELQDSLKSVKENHEYFRSVLFRPPEEQILQSASLKTLQASLEEQMTIARENKERYDGLNTIVDSLRDGQEAFRESVIHEAKAEIDTLRNHLRAKEGDVARLRGQRDAFKEEVEVRKAEQSVQFNQAAEMKALAEARGERLRIMRSEVGRLKSKIAAVGGEEDLLAFLLETPISSIENTTSTSEDALPEREVDYVRNLQHQLAETKLSLETLKAQLAEYAQGSTETLRLIESETAARENAERLQKALTAKEELLHGQGPEESIKILDAQQKRIKNLELQVRESDASMNALYGEVDAMSRAYEGMEALAVKKVYDLKAMEDAVLEARGARQKADHKYFAECRRITGLQEQQAITNKVLELQRVALEKAKEVENVLHQQLSAQEKEMTILKNTVVECNDKVISLNRQVVQYRAEAESNATRFEEAQKVLSENVKIASEEIKKRQRAEDELAEVKFKLGQMEDIVKRSQQDKLSAKEVELQRERDMLFVSGFPNPPPLSLSFLPFSLFFFLVHSFVARP